MLRIDYQNSARSNPIIQTFVARALTALVLFTGVGYAAAEGTVVVSMEPYKEMVEALAPDGTEVQVILPAGQSPHAYEPAPSAAAALEDATLVVYNGAVDEWMTALLGTVESVQTVVRALDSADVSVEESHDNHAHDDDHAHKDEHTHSKDAHDEHAHEDEHGHDEHAHEDEHGHDEHAHEDEHGHDEHAHEDEHGHDEHAHEDEHGHDEHAHEDEHGHDEHAHEDEHGHDEHAHEDEHGHDEHAHEDEHDHDHNGDTHVWQSIEVMKRVAEDVAAALSALHPDNAEEIAASLNTYLGQLDALDQELEATYATVQGLPLIFMHGAWDRLVDRYDLNQVAVIEPFPGREPSASYLAGVLNTIEQYDAQVIFSERQLNPRPANVIAQEAGVQVAILDPVGGGDTGGYSQMMRSNARTIADALAVAE